jgi:hypothetical protein
MNNYLPIQREANIFFIALCLGQEGKLKLSVFELLCHQQAATTARRLSFCSEGGWISVQHSQVSWVAQGPC